MSARILKGKVVRKNDQKTIAVDVMHLTRHPLYNKVLKKHKKYLCHCDDATDVAVGNIVEIVESAPFSKRKTWKMLKVVE